MHITGKGSFRSDGPLSAEGLSSTGRSVAYDPVQSGWVHLDAQDDLWPVQGTAVAGGTLGFRAWTSNDLAAYHNLLSDRALWRFVPEAYPEPFTQDVAATLLDIVQHGNHHIVQAVTLQERPIGQVRCLLPTDGDVAEISYWIGRPFWGKGLASRAVSKFSTYVERENPYLKRQEARIHADNLASQRVVLKAGFRKTDRRAEDTGFEIFERAA